MGKFEIEGFAKRKVKCDLAVIHITFRAWGVNPHESTKKVMEECDSFIKSLSKLSIKPKDVELESDRIDKLNYNDDKELLAQREIIIRMPFDVRIINRIQGALQEGKYNCTFYVSGDISFSHQLIRELSQEALNNSRDIADKLAASMDMKINGIESIGKDGWDVFDDDRKSRRAGDAGCCDILELDDVFGGPRISDEIEAKYIEKEVRMKIAWDAVKIRKTKVTSESA